MTSHFYYFTKNINKVAFFLSIMDLLKRYSDFGEEFKPSEIKIKKSLRVNTIKISEEELIKRLKAKKIKLEKVKGLDSAYTYSANFSMSTTQEYLQGYYYIQEIASQIPVRALNPEPGEAVLDMAASPGSKTTQIGELMKNEGVIVAVEKDKRRIPSLVNNLERLSIKNVLILRKDSLDIGDIGKEFDKILLDAPCSGNFCIEKDFFVKRKVRDFQNRAILQKDLLAVAYKLLKKGGTLVYSTCSLEPEEDELVIEWFLKKFTDMKLEKTDAPFGNDGLIDVFGEKLNPEIKKTKRFWPHKTGTQGFFIAKLIKR